MRPAARLSLVAALVLALSASLGLTGHHVARADDRAAVGTVRDATTGEPVAGAMVTLTVDGDEPLVVPSDDNGAYSFDLSGITASVGTIDVQAAGYVRQWYDGAATAEQATPVDLTAQTPADVALVPVTVVPQPDPATRPVPAPTLDSTTPVVGQVLTADAGLDPETPGLLAVTYAWFAGDTAIAAPTITGTLIVPALALGAPLRVLVTATYDDDTTTSAAGTASDPVGPGTLAGDQLPLVTGSFAVGQTLTATWATVPSATTSSFVWKHDGVPISGATEQTYTLAATDLGAAVSVEMATGAAGYTTQSASSAPSIVVAGTLAVGVPSIVGTVRQGAVVQAQTGAWGPAPIALSYEWRRGTKVVSRGPAYRVVVGDVGQRLTVTVTGRRAGYATATAAATTVPVVGLLTTVQPRVSGVVRVDGTVAVVPGAWRPAGVSFSYQWYRDGKVLTGQRSSRLRIPASLARHRLSVQVTATKKGYLTAARMSASYLVAPGAFVRAPAPHIVGAGAVGRVVRADAAGWSPAAGNTYRYQWRIDNAAVGGATGATFRIRPSDAGRRLSVTVTVSRAGYTTLARTSGALGVARPAPPPPPPPVRIVSYPNCAALQADYPNGVARAGVTSDRENGVPTAFDGTPFFNTALYNANSARDRDKDGIACEN